ncbi:MAG: 6-bladed beta-propeller [Bacteroidales bacterium]|jgi:hypothetical protein|nr:6-bladed beta-propeller [Bacteroidales bacterium]
MKKLNLIAVIFLFMLAACGGNKQSGNPDDALITVDVMASYPKKELILQDFMDVEYIPLETNNEFLCEGFVQDIGKHTILVKNYKSDGDIFVYDRTGKALRKINRMGKGPEEYNYALGITLDEENNEMFVNDHAPKKIMVYDLEGNFKRSFKHKEGNGSQFYTDIFNYDKDHLICYDEYNKEIPFVLVSKQDGSIIKEIKIPFKEKKAAVAIREDAASGMTYSVSPGPCRSIIPYNGNWILSEVSSDTVYSLLPDQNLRPFIVRTPPIESLDPEVFLMLRLFSDRYYFMETIKNEYNFDSRKGFPKTYFMYDRQEKAFSGYIAYNGDYSNKKEIYMSRLRPVSHEIESWQSINADDLLESLENGHLKGKLKEVAEGLEEESNPVIMLVKHKK